jgi:homoserine acetyltransferase
MIPDPENLLVMLQTWQSGDCSAQEPYNGNLEAAMHAIKAKALVLTSKTDLYFSYVTTLRKLAPRMFLANLK